MPLVWFSRFRTVIGWVKSSFSRPGRSSWTVLSRLSRFSAASCRTTEAFTTLVTEPARMRPWARAARPLRMSRTPAEPSNRPSLPPASTTAAVASSSGSPMSAARSASERGWSSRVTTCAAAGDCVEADAVRAVATGALAAAGRVAVLSSVSVVTAQSAAPNGAAARRERRRGDVRGDGAVRCMAVSVARRCMRESPRRLGERDGLPGAASSRPGEGSGDCATGAWTWPSC